MATEPPVILFDLDGVITSETGYWDAAGLMLRTLLSAPDYLGLSDWAFAAPASPEQATALRAEILPDALILALKGRAINSNWDIGYIAAALALLALLRNLLALPATQALASENHARKGRAFGLLQQRPINSIWLQSLGALLRERRQISRMQPTTEEPPQPAISPISTDLSFASAIRFYETAQAFLAATSGITGLALIEQLNLFGADYLCLSPRSVSRPFMAEAQPEHRLVPVFARYDSFWSLCYDLFQGWYAGGGPAAITTMMGPAWAGLITWERPLLPLAHISATLATLHAMGYQLGIATGRPYEEAIPPLRAWGILEYFDPRRIVTYREVRRAEQRLATLRQPRMLGKPHPFVYARAACPEADLCAICDEQFQLDSQQQVIVVGDSVSDILAGRRLGATTVAVLSGTAALDTAALRAAHPDYMLPDITALPDVLHDVVARKKESWRTQ